jgi:hypothetical protein
MEQTDPSSESSGSPLLVPCPGSPRKFLRLAPRVGHPSPPTPKSDCKKRVQQENGVFLEPPPYQEGSRITVILLPYAFFENHGISVTPPVTKTSGNGKPGFLQNLLEPSKPRNQLAHPLTNKQRDRETPLCQDTFYDRTPLLGHHFAMTPLC